jgi:hypothetical protein
MNFINFVIRQILLTGQFSDRSTAAFRLSLSCSSSLQANNMWSTVCSPLLQEHVGLSRILYLCRYVCTVLQYIYRGEKFTDFIHNLRSLQLTQTRAIYLRIFNYRQPIEEHSIYLILCYMHYFHKDTDN